MPINITNNTDTKVKVSMTELAILSFKRRNLEVPPDILATCPGFILSAISIIPPLKVPGRGLYNLLPGHIVAHLSK